jgi:hypothetical protein
MYSYIHSGRSGPAVTDHEALATLLTNSSGIGESAIAAGGLGHPVFPNPEPVVFS